MVVMVRATVVGVCRRPGRIGMFVLGRPVKVRSAGEYAVQQIDGGHEPNQGAENHSFHMHIMCINSVVVKRGA